MKEKWVHEKFVCQVSLKIPKYKFQDAVPTGLLRISGLVNYSEENINGGIDDFSCLRLNKSILRYFREIWSEQV